MSQNSLCLGLRAQFKTAEICFSKNEIRAKEDAQQLPNRSGQQRPIRHCEEPLRRSNPGADDARPLDCFASLAMTGAELAR